MILHFALIFCLGFIFWSFDQWLRFHKSHLSRVFFRMKMFWDHRSERKRLEDGLSGLRRILALLQSGKLPTENHWIEIRHLPEPWSPWVYQSIQNARDEGLSVLPLVRRWQKLLEDHLELLDESAGKAAQAEGQVIIGLLLIPSFSFLLFTMLPGLHLQKTPFLISVLGSCLLGFFAYLWVLKLKDQACYAGLSHEHRHWISLSILASEQIINQVLSGESLSAVFDRTRSQILQVHPDFIEVWSARIETVGRNKKSLKECLGLFSCELKEALQDALIEGTGVIDRLQALQQSHLAEVRLRIMKELQRLPNACLKPLFLLVFPAVLWVFVSGIYLGVFNEVG